MYVSEDHRGKGVAKEILTALEIWAIELDVTICVLETGTNQPEAISLYKKIGYSVTENYEPYVGVKNSVCMQKEIGLHYLK